MQKLLLGPEGLLHSQEGKKEFVELVSSQLSEGDPLADLLHRTLEVTADTLDPERLFLAFSKTLMLSFLQKPAKPATSTKGFGALIEHCFWGSLMGDINAPTASWERFMVRYSKKPQPSAAGILIQQDLDELYSRLENKLKGSFPVREKRPANKRAK